MLETSEVYRSRDLLARAVVGASPERCVVTFAPFEDHHSLDRAGFGESWFRLHGFDAIHVIPRVNHWYQHAELPELCARVAATTRTYRDIVAYGSSMGGSAAVRYGAWVGASVAFALSPQFTINPWRPPFEKRWRYN